MKLWNNTLRSSTWSHLFSLFTSDWKEILLNILRRNPNLSNKCTYTLYRGYSYQIANLCVTVKYFLKRNHFFNNAKCRKTNFEGHVYQLLTKLVRSTWLDIDQVLFLRVYPWTETKSKSINTQKKKKRPISSQLDRTCMCNIQCHIRLHMHVRPLQCHVFIRCSQHSCFLYSIYSEKDAQLLQHGQ